MDEPISHLPEKEQGVLLTINGDPEVGETLQVWKRYLFFCVLLFLLC